MDSTFDYKGHTFGVEHVDDEDQEAPWDACDGHGPVSEWTRRDKRSGERVLCEDHGQKRYYDFAAAMKLAKKDGWGTVDGRRPGETAGAHRARAIEADFDFLRGWCNDDWTYIGVVVTLLDEDDEPTDFKASLWGVESCAGDYLTTVAHELADEVLAELPEAVAAKVAALQSLVS